MVIFVRKPIVLYVHRVNKDEPFGISFFFFLHHSDTFMKYDFVYADEHYTALPVDKNNYLAFIFMPACEMSVNPFNACNVDN